MKTQNHAHFGLTRILVAAVAGLTVVIAPSARAQLLEYEGFDYAAALIQGQNGGTGWSTNLWSDPDNDTPLSNDGVSLTFPPTVSHTATGSRIVFGAAGEAERRLGTSMNLATEGSTYYFSALVKRQGSFRFEFIDNGTNIRWRFGGQGDSSTNTAVLGVAGDTFVNNVFPAGETVYIVAKILTHASANDQVFLSTYRAGDFVPTSEPVTWQAVGGTVNSASGVTLTRLQIRNIDNLPLEIDEIRIGTNFAQVAGVFSAGPPIVTKQPVAVSDYSGASAQFWVEVTGAEPLFYQWYHGDNLLAGATNALLQLTNVQPAQAGNYWVIVSNSVDTAISDAAPLTLIAITNISVGLQALWHFDETNGLTAFDATTNHNNGTLLNYAGDNSQWIASDYNRALAFNRAVSNAVEVPDSPSIGAKLVNRFSLATWIRSAVPLTANSQLYRMLEKENSYFLLQGDGNTNGLGNGGISVLVKKGGANIGLGVGQALDANRWYHVAVTYDGAILSIYLDGELKGTRAVASPIDSTTLPLRIGSDYMAAGTGMKYLDGAMDEVGIWDRALQPSEVIDLAGLAGVARILAQPQSQSPYAGGSAMFTVQARGLNLRYLWYQGTNEIRTATTNVLTLVNVQAADAGDYYCKISNDAGDVLTQVAALTVIPVTGITNGMEAQWKFDEFTGLVAADASGLGRDGQLVDFAGNDTQWGAGQVIGGLTFDGLANRVVANNSSNANLGTDATFAFWLRPTSYGSEVNHGTFFSHNSRIMRKGGRFDIELVDDPGSVRATLRVNGIPAPLQNIVALNEWQHFVVQISGGAISFYKNGFLVGSPVNGNFGAANTNSIVIGNYVDTLATTNLYAGALDEVGVWGRRLSETEILTLANRDVTGAPVIVAQPQSTTRYSGGTVTFAVDATGARPLTFKWYRGSTPLPDSNTNRLVLTNLTLSDAGNYTVTVTNSSGTATSDAAVLTIQDVAGITTGLIAYWPFDETAGTVFQDASGHGHHAALQNGSAVPGTAGVVGGAYSFDGVDDFAIVPHAAELNLNGQATISVWLNPRALAATGDRARIVRKDINFDFTLLSAPNGSTARFMMYGANKSELLAPANSVTSNQWQHLAVVVKDGTVQFFKNGRAMAEPIPGVLGSAITNDLIIGNFGPDLSISRLCSGVMDELGIWDRALTAADIDGIYQNGLAGRSLSAPYEPFQIRQVGAPSPGQVRMVFFSPFAGRQPVVQRSDNLASTNWAEQTAVTFNALTGGLTEALFSQTGGALAFYRLAILPQGPLFVENFETGGPGWTHGGAGDNWEIGVPVNGPAAAVSGTNVAATSLAGNINPYSDCYLRSPAIALTNVARATLTFQQWRNVDPSEVFHGTIVNILDAGTLEVIQQLSLEAGATTGYQQRTLPLPPQILGRTVIIEFRLYSDAFNLLEGWYIDDVKILPE